MTELELHHHGILGQRWGVRRFQRSDGTLTAAGKERYTGFGKATSSIPKNMRGYYGTLSANNKAKALMELNSETHRRDEKIRIAEDKIAKKIAKQALTEADTSSTEAINASIEYSKQANSFLRNKGPIKKYLLEDSRSSRYFNMSPTEQGQFMTEMANKAIKQIEKDLSSRGVDLDKSIKKMSDSAKSIVDQFSDRYPDSTPTQRDVAKKEVERSINVLQHIAYDARSTADQQIRSAIYRELEKM